MPKTNVLGGKKKKKGKNGTIESSQRLELADSEGQHYAKVEKALGCGRFLVQCFDLGKELIGVVCGKMRKRVWVNAGDYVIIALRDFDNGTHKKCDIIHKYTESEAKKLIKRKEIASFEIATEDINFEEHDILDEEIETTGYNEEEENEKERQKAIESKKQPYLVLNMPSFSDEEDNEIENL